MQPKHILLTFSIAIEHQRPLYMAHAATVTLTWTQSEQTVLQ